MKYMKFSWGVALAVILVLTSTPSASAYTNSNSARIAELQATIMRLQAELARLQTGSGAVTSGDVRIVDHGSVEMRGVASGRTGDSARGWFEYGPTYAMQYSTPMNRVTAGRTFYGVADDIDSGRTYYYRAVTESKNGYITEGLIHTFQVTGNWSRYNDWDDDDRYDADDEDVPEVTTDDADDIDENSAELRGEVDMQDAEDGIVFFVYGEDEDMVEEVTDENRYRDIDEDGDDLQLVKVDSSFDGDEDFYAVVTGLDDNTDHYFRLCVEFENDDNDDEIVCGDVETFETD